jgi:hypothetical protein
MMTNPIESTSLDPDLRRLCPRSVSVISDAHLATGGSEERTMAASYGLHRATRIDFRDPIERSGIHHRSWRTGVPLAA